MPQDAIEIQVVTSLAMVAQSDWDSCACPETGSGKDPRALDPFTTYRFLWALETSGSVGEATGWQPYFLLAFQKKILIGCTPLYLKSHSQGEYIFDHSFAEAYHRAGGHYYPKLQIAVPFTPVTGRRFLLKPGYEVEARQALIQGALQFAVNNKLSSLHATFCTQQEAKAGEGLGLLSRTTQQFHWENPGYESFDGFLSALSSRKRKNIRKERVQANQFGGEIEMLTGAQIEPHHWDAFWRFYQDTGARKWGTPYLTRAFFDAAQDSLRDDILLVMAKRDGQYVAGAMNFIGRDCLYGRYWGCIEDHPCLHFELCYYRAIDFAIKHNLDR
ncbi:MAG TPA: GNAT family N-acetyltransferase, partial [Rhodobacteraceae bacterium]|nr:GNAT family N-acetyltransferase [Paracoccaceae bacterium]